MPFRNEAQEVIFFKNIKPAIHALLIYHSKVLEIELKKPVGTTDDLRYYYEEYLKQIKMFFDLNSEMYQYYRSDGTHMDSQYFKRNISYESVSDVLRAVKADNSYTTPKDYIIAQIIGNNHIEIYLKNVISIINGVPKSVSYGTGNALKWKGPKVGLIELGYACKEAGIFEEPLNDIFRCFEKAFSVQLGNTSRTFQEILSRKRMRPPS